ncbi:hypothetical protein GCM10022416_18360 [Actinomadura keratinilytica]|uniref:Uncharacterized protein n=1 Tax=Actinomadura keratinilytica TaxID=547461 RepID=A0ABP7YG70_9ACTN
MRAVLERGAEDHDFKADLRIPQRMRQMAARVCGGAAVADLGAAAVRRPSWPEPTAPVSQSD